ncbi:uncharacterized protein LOC129588925 [Paramacrobiotus metropolitanus]|uniref:uncharacterized protein LOC129588925 n=1 Tax=Paramacrobiotus metropolitanus TaxID=2943436 RepID=UPI002445E0CD|nr:uncharacterized protein LOC129588925 [Paramacrobiotus metropolitanus]
MSVVLSVLLLAMCAGAALSQQSQYVDYRAGTLNLIISAPHGGSARPAAIRNRTAGCYVAATRRCEYRHGCTPDKSKCPTATDKDMNTFEAAEKLRQYVYELTGRYPYFVANKLHRTKLDPNRAVNEAAFGEPLAVTTYDFYHAMITAARTALDADPRYASHLLIDLHGQSHTHELTEIGYNLTAAELDAGVYDLQRSSSIRYLANKFGNSNQVVIGNISLGRYLEDAGMNVMPGPREPRVNGRKYFDGGYTVETHNTAHSDAIQIELARSFRLAEAGQFDTNVRNLAEGLVRFLRQHYPENAGAAV